MNSPQLPLADYRRAEFRTSRFLLRPARAEDQGLMFGWRSDVDTSRYLSGAAPKSIENQREWFERVCRDTSYSYHIVEDQGVPIGFTSMFNAAPTNADAEWGLIIGKQREPGDVRVVAPLCCKSAFKFGELNALYTCINEDNVGAIRRVQKMGARRYESPSAYRKKGELLFRIDSEEFKKVLLTLAASNPEWTDELDVEMHVVDTGY